ncbi:MAG TPA: glycosyltransferase [Phycisphaerae bacterium]|nr:glycosyltransferase [Phycisphaerae bacterium]
MTGTQQHVDGPPIALPAPLFPEVGVLGLVPDPWNSPWMPRHHVMSRLAKYFHVAWMDPARGWRECWLGRNAPQPQAPKTAPPQSGFSVYTPGRWEAKFYRPAVVARATERRRLSHAAATLRNHGCRKFILYAWRPEFAGALDVVDHDVSCYHIDDEYSFSRDERPVDEREAALLKRVDHVFIHSPALWAKKSAYNPSTHMIPIGADYRSFSTPRAEPADLRAVPHPRIGYVGYVKGQLDLPLMTALASAHADWSFVFVGPLNANMPRHAAELEALSRLPNVHMLGGRSVGELPAYVQHMDVLTLAYRLNDYTKFITPMKLHEYLASGRPVVGSPIPYLGLFRDVLALAETPRQWSAAIGEALRPHASGPQRIKQRRRVARRHDWGRIALRIAWAICGSLGDDYVRRVTEAYGPPPLFAGRGHGEMSMAPSENVATAASRAAPEPRRSKK